MSYARFDLAGSRRRGNESLICFRSHGPQVRLLTSSPTHKWRSAVDSHHKPEGSHSLAPRPGPLVRLTLRSCSSLVVRGSLSDDECSTPSMRSSTDNEPRTTNQTGPRGRTRTCNLPVLSGTPLLIGLHADGSPSRSSMSEGWCSRSELHRHWAGFKSAASALGYGSRLRAPRFGAPRPRLAGPKPRAQREAKAGAA